MFSYQSSFTSEYHENSNICVHGSGHPKNMPQTAVPQMDPGGWLPV